MVGTCDADHVGTEWSDDSVLDFVPSPLRKFLSHSSRVLNTFLPHVDADRCWFTMSRTLYTQPLEQGLQHPNLPRHTPLSGSTRCV